MRIWTWLGEKGLSIRGCGFFFLGVAIRLLADDLPNRDFRPRDVWRRVADLCGRTPDHVEHAARRALRKADSKQPVPEDPPGSREFLRQALDDLFPEAPDSAPSSGLQRESTPSGPIARPTRDDPVPAART